MSYRIDQIEDALKTTIEAALIDEGGVAVTTGTLEDYLIDGRNDFPLVCVALESQEVWQNMYPGTTTLSVYFVGDIGSGVDPEKTNRMKLYSYMKTIFDTLNGKTAGLNLQGAFRLLGSSLNSYENYMSYKQTWTCTAL
ncbi:MAG: hypothetical protein LLG05_14840 [Porphyromonadaceae bacterium]|nr:hypothetical protein [Porphyromonadaceae bacterium]